MGCALCCQLVDTWRAWASRSGQGAMELSGRLGAFPAGYHRVTGLHYMSSFSDAEDCCDDSSAGSSPSGD